MSSTEKPFISPCGHVNPLVDIVEIRRLRRFSFLTTICYTVSCMECDQLFCVIKNEKVCSQCSDRIDCLTRPKIKTFSLKKFRLRFKWPGPDQGEK